MSKTILVLLLALALALPTFAGGFGIGPQVGYYKAKDADEGKFLFGGAARLKLGSALGVEGAINYRQEKYSDGAVTLKSWPILVTGLIYPVPILYGAVGAGWYNTTINYQDEIPGTVEDETTQEFGWHFGGGLELPLGNVKLAGDIRYVFLDYEFEHLPGSAEVKNDFYMIQVSLFFGL